MALAYMLVLLFIYFLFSANLGILDGKGNVGMDMGSVHHQPTPDLTNHPELVQLF